MAPPARRPKAVANESPASGPLHNLQSELLAAKAAWEQLGVRIAKGYTTAYVQHTKTLELMKKVKEAKQAASAAKMQFVFSVISIGFAGGVVGGLVAPWVKRGGEGTSQFVFREGVRSVMQQGAKDLVKAGDERLFKYLGNLGGSGDLYTTNSPKDLAVDEEIRDRIASAFGPLLEALDAMIDEANSTQADAAAGQTILNSFRQNCPLMTDKPEQSDIPAESTVAVAAELAMWVGWANERDWDWWNAIYRQLDGVALGGAAPSAYDQSVNETSLDFALELDPIGDRMQALGKRGEVINSTKKWVKQRGMGPDGWADVPYIDLRKIKTLKIQSIVPFRGMSALDFQWNKTSPLAFAAFASNLRDLKPVYK